MAKTRKQFEEFHANNPEVFRLFCYFTNQVMLDIKNIQQKLSLIK